VPYTDVWKFQTVASYPGKHPCEKPLPLLRHIIGASSKPGAVVLDAFMGHGNTGLACLELGRRFVGIEKDVKHFRTARARIEHARRQNILPLFQDIPTSQVKAPTSQVSKTCEVYQPYQEAINL
jgi:DNA modification methylase